MGRSKSKYQSKVDICLSSNEDPSEDHDHACNKAFWQGLLISEMLWNVGCGAEVLVDESFQTFLCAAWDLFDDFDAVNCLLGQVGWGRMRPKLEALREFKLEERLLRQDPQHAQSQLQKATLLLQQITSMCRADPRLARTAALYGVSFLADRMRSTANASVNFVDGAVGSAAAQVNRSAAALNEELRAHVEELLEGKKVKCCFTSGHFKIVNDTGTTPKNALADFDERITAHIEAKVKTKVEHVRPGSAPAHKRKEVCIKPETLRPPSAQSRKRTRPKSATNRKRVNHMLTFGL